MTVKTFTLALLLGFICQLTYAQPKLSWYYPKLGEVDARSGKKGVYHTMDVEIGGCASGNCKSGTGTYLTVSRLTDTVFPAMSIEPILQFTLYKGQFSNDGKDFEGTVFSRRVYYDVVYRKDDPHLVPKQSADLREDAFWKPYEVGTGTMAWKGFGYRWNGWMSKEITGNVQPGQAKSFKIHFNWDEIYAKIQYAEGGAYTQVEGRLLPNGDFLSGRIHFSDGSLYEGTLYHGKLFGLGRYTSKDGKVEEGIWEFDQLTQAMEVKFPKAFFEPGKQDEISAQKPLYGGKHMLTDKYFDAGGGWILANGPTNLFLGKADAAGFNGPAVWISIKSEYYNPPRDFISFRVGMFKNGQLQTGTKIQETATLKTMVDAGGFKQYTSVLSTRTIGSFFNDALAPGCATGIGYDADYNPVSMGEGYFQQSQLGYDFGSGWAYVNDWNKERDVAHLQYRYNGQNYLTMSDDPVYTAWFANGANDAHKASFCFPEMKEQAPIVLKQIDQRAEEVKAKAEKREAYTAAQKAEWAKYSAECEAEAARYGHQPGQLLVQKVDGYLYQHVLITGRFNCSTKTYPTISQHCQSAANGGSYCSAGDGQIAASKLSAYSKLEGSYQLCTDCKGRGTMPATYYTSVGGNSGYTYIGGGWMVKNPRTYWKHEYMDKCGKCSGTGFMRR